MEIDIDAIRQSPRQFVDLQTVEILSDMVEAQDMTIESLRQQLVACQKERDEAKEETRITKEVEFPRKLEKVADNWKLKLDVMAVAMSSLQDRIDYLEKGISERQYVCSGLNNDLRIALGTLKYAANNYDCDSDAHKYGTNCPVCDAAKALSLILGEEHVA